MCDYNPRRFVVHKPDLCVDLHCHSTASDGVLSPAELLARAAERGVTHLALTDHDTLAGLAEARQAAQDCGVHLINGIELSCQWRQHTIHVVGLDVRDDDAPFLARVTQQTENRWARARLIADRLERLKVPDLVDRATAQAGGSVPGRPHFAAALVEAGAVKSPAQAFKRHLGAGKPGDVRAFWPPLEDVVAWILEAGGVPVLAHPRKYKMTATRLRDLVRDFQEAGGQGLEVMTSGQSPADLSFLADLCEKRGLWASQGSDFHFPGAPWCELGQGMGQALRLPDRLEPVWRHFRAPVVQPGG
ncbi:PHP domain-containing protein [Marinobacter sp. C2H3]|uniref:PHP domain-containing protein n=1 Tax=Marinobacter sp. C2H3 TaxID=3119003 RepID=UPI003FA5E6E9